MRPSILLALASGLALLVPSVGRSTQNSPPLQPVPLRGAPAVTVGVLSGYKTVTTDPDGDMLTYVFSWGDGTTSSVGPFIPSGTAVTGNHTWIMPGTYAVRAYAYDQLGQPSPWSATLTVQVAPKSGGSKDPYPKVEQP